MNVQVKAVVVRDTKTGRIMQLVPILDDDNAVEISYSSELIGPIETLRDALNEYDTEVLKQAYYDYVSDGVVTLYESAKHLPSIGLIEVKIETREFEWY
jgi:hypothetical protein